MKIKPVCLLIAIGMLLSACSSSKVQVAQSELPRETVSDAANKNTSKLVADNTTFAFNLFQQVKGEQGNLVYSPYSISLAAAMLYGGAKGDTAAQMQKTMQFNLPADEFNQAFNALSLEIAGRAAESKKIDKKHPMELDIANAVWGQKDYAFEQAYLDLLAKDYGAGIRLVDFMNAPDDAANQVNDWVDSQTKGKIQKILSPDAIDASTRMILANAIYFKAAWQEAFVAKLTADAPFTLLDGSQVQVPMMRTEESVPISVSFGDGYTATALPYKGDLAEMIILMPDEGNFENFQNSLNAAKFTTILNELQPDSYMVYMPKFEFTADLDLKTILAEMGMPGAFDPEKADLSGIASVEKLYVGQALHKAYILVNEEGTTAAAVTVLGVTASAMPMELRIDKPFLFAIIDKPTGTILFLGRVLNPTG
jgi:serpin B